MALGSGNRKIESMKLWIYFDICGKLSRLMFLFIFLILSVKRVSYNKKRIETQNRLSRENKKLHGHLDNWREIEEEIPWKPTSQSW